MSFAADGSADAVVTIWTLYEMDNPRAILREAHRGLRPGGEILVVDFPKDSLAKRPWNEDYYRPDDVRAVSFRKPASRTCETALSNSDK